MANPESPIHQLVAQLPEIYQPILGYPEYDESASRAQDQRLAAATQLYDALVELKGRPLKVLDLGCAQGYFSLTLASRGAQVRGIDYLDANVAVCRQLADENPHLSVSFAVDRIEAVVESLQAGDYDLVLGLSVFHHLVYLHGETYIKALLERVASAGASLLTEMALASEPLYWAAAQPEDPRSLLDGIAFVRCLGEHATHLSEIKRPLYFASQDTWYLGGRAAHFTDWRRTSHDLAQDAHRGTRSYYFAAPMMAKKFLVGGNLGQGNLRELNHEAAVLEMELPIRVPRLLDLGEAHGEKWLVREMIPGRLLSDSLSELDGEARKRILGLILQQLAGLEERGLFHNDVRLWNVLLDPEGQPHLIDYGAIGSEASDCVWPYEIHLAFVIFAQELMSGEITTSDPLRRVAVSPGSLVAELQAWAVTMFRKSPPKWTFAEMSSALAAHWGVPVSSSADLGVNEHLWLTLLEQASQTQLHHAKHLRAQVDVANFDANLRAQQERSLAWSEKEEVRAEAGERAAQLADEIQELRGEHAGLKTEFVHLRGEFVEDKAELEQIKSYVAENTETVRAGFSRLDEKVDGLIAQGAEAMELHRRGYESAISQISWLVAHVEQLDQRASGFDSELGTLREEVFHGSHGRAIQVLQDEIAIIKASRSWRLTEPLRAVNRRLGELKLRAKIRLRPLAVRIARRLLAMPRVKRHMRSIVSLHPGFSARVRRFVQGAGLIGVNAIVPVAHASVPSGGALSRRAAVLATRVRWSEQGQDDRGTA